ncbi:MAG: ABC transporter ATP-binding protein [Clostridium sp.]|nr:ABC transporter ATP-binding protein [Clostridium sp.]
MESIKWIFRYLNKYKYKYSIGIFLVLLISLVNMINPFLFGKIIDEVIGEGKVNLLMPIIISVISIVLLKNIIGYTYQMIFENVSQSVLLNVRQDLYEKLLSLDFTYYNSVRTGDIMARMTGDTDALRHFLAWVIFCSVEQLSVFIFAICSMIIISPTLTVVMLTMCPIIYFLTKKMSDKIQPTFYAIREAYSSLNSVVQENISGNRVVRAFNREKYEIEKFDKENKNYRDKNLESVIVTKTYIPRLNLAASMLSVIMILVGGVLVINNRLTLGDIVVFNNLLWALNNPMRMVGTLVNDTQRFIASSAKIRELLNTESKIKNHSNHVNLGKIKGDIKFENVSFKFEDTDAISNISFEVKRGETVGIVGHTGAGKSTLINLLCRFYDPTEGRILIDGIDIKEIDLATLRSSITSAMQEIFLFSDTIKDNIAYGNPKASLEEIKLKAKKSQAHDFITKLDDGYETVVGERGVGLSGGQKQRISLARALMKDSSILILDDITSAVDMETEKRIQKELKSIGKEKTKFIIAHRISSVRQADVILVLDNGEIVEQGNHQELIEKRGYYYTIYNSQSGNFNVQKGAVNG